MQKIEENIYFSTLLARAMEDIAFSPYNMKYEKHILNIKQMKTDLSNKNARSKQHDKNAKFWIVAKTYVHVYTSVFTLYYRETLGYRLYQLVNVLYMHSRNMNQNKVVTVWTPTSENGSLRTCAPSNSDQTAHSRSLIWIAGLIWDRQEWTAKELIRLRCCVVWFDSSLDAHVKRYLFSHCEVVVLQSGIY